MASWVDDHLGFRWTLFLVHTKETFKDFVRFVKLVQNQINLKIISLRSDHSGGFINHHFKNFWDKTNIAYNFSCMCTPQENDVVGRKKFLLEILAHIMISEISLPN